MKVEESNLQEIAKKFELILQSDPYEIQSLEILREVYLKMGRVEDALTISRKMADAYIQLGELSYAILEYEGILQKNPTDEESIKKLQELNEKVPQESMQSSAQSGSTESVSVSSGGKEDGNLLLAKFLEEHRVLKIADVSNILNMVKAKMIVADHEEPNVSFLQLLSEHGIISIEKSLTLLLRKARVPYLSLDFYDVDRNCISILEKGFCFRNLVLPLSRMSKITFVATVNPFDLVVRQEVESKIEGKVRWYMTHPEEMMRQLKNQFRSEL